MTTFSVNKKKKKSIHIESSATAMVTKVLLRGFDNNNHLNKLIRQVKPPSPNLNANGRTRNLFLKGPNKK